jgi:hypothetical protein
MTYEITRADMRLKVERALHDGGDLYTFDDIMALIKEGKMQSFTCGDTWIVTQVNEFPRKKVLEIALVVGNIWEAIEFLPEIYDYARQVGATRVTGFGRDGWWEHHDAGWKKVGTMYAKDMHYDA